MAPELLAALRTFHGTVAGFHFNNSDLGLFVFQYGLDLLDLRRVDHLAVRSYLAHLGRRKLARSSMARHLSALRSFFKYLMREGVVEANPARIVATPKRQKQLPSVMQTSEVALLIETPNIVCVHPDFPAKSLAEVVAWAKANPGKLTWGSQGFGTAPLLRRR